MSEMTLAEALRISDSMRLNSNFTPTQQAQDFALYTLAARVRELEGENAKLLTTAKELLRLTDRGTHGYATYNPDGSIGKVRDGFNIVTDARAAIAAAIRARWNQ